MLKKAFIAALTALLILTTTGCGNFGSTEIPKKSASDNSASSSRSTSSRPKHNYGVSEEEDESKTPPAEGSGASSGTASVAKTVRVTIPEGFTFDQIAARLEENGVCSKADFYAASESYQPKSLNVPTDSSRAYRMEGYLFPATYDFTEGEDAEDVLIDMLNAYRDNSGGISDEELIVASILECEARSAEHMSMVAGVLYNRLNAGMMLQMDSTREYINDHVTGSSLLGDTSKYAALYNTYKCSALPAGPICNPGTKAMQAAMNPADTDALYFFFGNDNQNHYSATLEEHEAAMEKYGVQFG
ncbi:endolytic transglycosylase MltG [Candidatus Soleaferrea massiliensis]|uniref:endolytic transglycosylase MltG n=1 Tax=Candidatus Soleaferrea massiliensis TaxID=1470354 RepID=UPI0006934C6A|nr:endolytic transglycosylase MltG [Candidatus Soleaferrea massiliensis]